MSGHTLAQDARGAFGSATWPGQVKGNSRSLDPVQHLPPEVIAIIISSLEPEDTETLRWLSKSWKGTSEASNTNQAILRYFPLARCPALDTGPEYNLYFRRLGTSKHRYTPRARGMKLICSSLLPCQSETRPCDEVTSLYRGLSVGDPQRQISSPMSRPAVLHLRPATPH